MISNIQALRAFAAAAVVFYHTDFHFNGDVHTEFQGVAIFFVISGFIITYITRSKTEGFLVNRATRVVPLYWAMTLFLIVFGWLLSATALAVRNLTHADPIPQCIFCHIWTWLSDGDNIVKLAKSLFFIPYTNASGDPQPLLGVGWTLNLEVLFYVIFAISLQIRAAAAPLLACGVLIGLKLLKWIAWPDGPAPLYVDFYSQEYTTFFVLGVACFYIWRFLASRGLLHQYRTPLILAASIVIALFFLVHTGVLRLVDGAPAQRLLFFAFPPAIVLLALILHSIDIRVTSRIVIMLGDASYALYLLHTIVFELMRPFWRRFPAADPKYAVIPMIVAVATCCVLALVVHYFVEKPMIAGLRRARRRTASERATAADTR